MVPDLKGFTFYQGKRVDKNENIGIIEIMIIIKYYDNDNYYEDKVSKWQATEVKVARESTSQEIIYELRI